MSARTRLFLTGGIAIAGGAAALAGTRSTWITYSSEVRAVPALGGTARFPSTTIGYTVADVASAAAGLALFSLALTLLALLARPGVRAVLYGLASVSALALIVTVATADPHSVDPNRPQGRKATFGETIAPRFVPDTRGTGPAWTMAGAALGAAGSVAAVLIARRAPRPGMPEAPPEAANP